MEIINAAISADFSLYSVLEGIKCLHPAKTTRVRLLLSSNHSFHNIYKIIYKDSFSQECNIKPEDIDTSEILENDSWMLFDYQQQKIYYNKGA